MKVYKTYDVFEKRTGNYKATVFQPNEELAIKDAIRKLTAIDVKANQDKSSYKAILRY